MRKHTLWRKWLAGTVCGLAGIFIFGAFSVGAQASEVVSSPYFGPGLQSEEKSSEAPATSYRTKIDDQADLLTDEQEKKLLARMEELSEYGNVMFATVKGNSEHVDTAKKADLIYGRAFGYKADGVMFLIDMDSRQIYLYSCGALEKSVKVSDCEAITDNVYGYASDAKYYSCADKAFEQVKVLLEDGEIAKPMMTTLIVLLSVYFGAFIMSLVVMGSRKLRKADVQAFAEAGKTSFAAEPASSVLTGTTRHYSPVSSGGGGGGGHGGGGHSGGGGGHGGGHSF